MNPSRILIVRLSSLGDIVLVSPVTRALKKAYPKAGITMLVKKAYAPIARCMPGVDEVDVFDEDQGLRSLASRVRHAEYDLMVDLHANIRSRLLAWSGRPGRVIRYRKRRPARMGMVHFSGGTIKTRHTVDLYLQTLQALDISEADRSPDLIVSDEARQHVEEMLRRNGVQPTDQILAFAPGASHPTKQWPAASFALLADRLIKSRGLPVLLIGGEQDRETAAAVVQSAALPVIDWTGRLDLSLLPAAVQRCRLLVSNDSGPMHVASAVRTPVIGLFGPTHPRLGFSPLGARDRAISLDLPCSPCSLHGEKACKFHTNECLQGLAVERVISEIDQAI